VKTLHAIFVCAVLGIGQVIVSHAAEVKLTADDTTAWDGFGHSVSITRDYVIVGAPLNNDAGINAGSAYIFIRSGIDWKEQAKLTASDVAAGDNFGHSVAISRDTAIVGAPSDDDAGAWSGSAYIFVRRGRRWEEQAKLTARDATVADAFGHSVAISRDTAIVGAPFDDDVGDGSGSAYLFVRRGETWTQQAKLAASDGVEDDRFGHSVAISDDFAIAGAPFDDDAGAWSGSVYTFMRRGETWTQQAKLTASDAAKGDLFGISVSISRDFAIVGAPFDDDAGSRSGSAYIFMRRREAWAQQAKVTASDAGKSDQFGTSVAIDVNRAIVGAYLYDGKTQNSGSAYSFLRVDASWIERTKITPRDAGEDNAAAIGAQGDQFGYSVAISGDFAIAGARYDDTLEGGPDGGSAYMYHSSTDLNVPLPVELALLAATTLGQVKRTALLQNFPNPFNPETWLPYALATDAPVTIGIYDVQGQFVRQLDMGEQQAGGYFSREKAAYWDGKDQLGRAVSSGIYFYTLTADSFHATRRLLILK
jgi:hypothetical protein